MGLDFADQSVVASEHSVEALQHAVVELDSRLAAQDKQQFLQPKHGHAGCISLAFSGKYV